MNPHHLIPPLFLCLSLAGCSSSSSDELGDGMGFQYDGEANDYNGAPRGDDNDLYLRYTFPIGQPHQWTRLVNDPDYGTGTSFACFAHHEEWEGRPYWVEFTLYEEIDGELVSRQQWDLDCKDYWGYIDEEGRMELHEGDPPWLDSSRGIPGPGALVVLALGLAAWDGWRRGR